MTEHCPCEFQWKLLLAGAGRRMDMRARDNIEYGDCVRWHYALPTIGRLCPGDVYMSGELCLGHFVLGNLIRLPQVTGARQAASTALRGQSRRNKGIRDLRALRRSIGPLVIYLPNGLNIFNDLTYTTFGFQITSLYFCSNFVTPFE